jgi:disulfide bond formation protein DsbB
VTTDTAALFFALLALLALAGALVGLVAIVGRHRTGRLAALADDLGSAGLWVAWLVATVATLGSLYLSEIAHFTPCPLCWYQRIAMYPLVVLLGIAAVRRDTNIRPYVITQAGIGAVIAAYHSWIQAFPPVGGSTFCTADAPCTARYIWEFGFVSIPFMALCGFLTIVVFTLLAGRRTSPAAESPELTSNRVASNGDRRPKVLQP